MPLSGHSAAYDAVCERLHTASLRTIVVGPDPRLTPKSVVGILDVLDVNWGVLVGDRVGAELAWELAATRLDRFTGLVAIDRGHPRVADHAGVIRDDHCPPVEINTTVLVSTPAAQAVARASQRFVYGDYRVVELLGTAQRARVDRATGRRDRPAHQHLVTDTDRVRGEAPCRATNSSDWSPPVMSTRSSSRSATCRAG